MTVHLGSQLSALADGRLSGEQEQRALAHVAACPLCAAELADARAARAALAASDAPDPTPDLAVRLLAMRAAPPVRPGDPFAGDAVHAGRVHGRLPGPSARRRVVGVTGSVAAAAAVALFWLGARPAVAPDEQPVHAMDLLAQAAAATASASLPDADDLAAAGWTYPVAWPTGWTATAVDGVRSDVLRVTLHGPGYATAVVTEQQGRLDASATTGLATTTVGDRTVAVLSWSPWTVVWQADSTVVEVVASSAEVGAVLVPAFPAGPFDTGVTARIGRGWESVTAAFRS